ncbi:MAG: hypothetical protein CVT92_02820 [Bacteroidetes bacterium HGW-Bacteroidetes-1]|jgi:ligand-binding sensor domain-containing protein|nr:MAG: hypothetical protein CVT92_02820 [Bacteroidetes bacterium HGW-Bacteroidetes-1]
MQLLKINIIINLLLLSCISIAQTPFYRIYDIRHGLPSSEVYDVVQDSMGYLLFATDHGLARFDGYRFKTFEIVDGMPENAVFYLQPDPYGKIWFNTYDGKFGYYDQGKIFSYKHNDKLKSFLDKNKYTFAIYQSYNVDKNENIRFFLQSSGAQKIDTSGNITSLHSSTYDNILSIELLANGRTFLKPPNDLNFSMIEITDGHQKKIYNIAAHQINNTKPQHLEAKHNNGSIFLSMNEKVFLFKDDSIKKIAFTGKTNLGLGIDNRGNVWVLTLSGGVFLYDNELNFIARFFEKESITSFFQDHEGGIWLTSLNKGVFYIPDISHTTFTMNDGLPDNEITDIAVDREGSLWFISKPDICGKITTQGIQFFQLNLPKGVSASKILSDNKKDCIWVTTDKFLYCIEGNNIRKKSMNYAPKLSQKTFPAAKYIVQDSATGVIYIGHFSGISNLKPDGSTSFYSYLDTTFLERVECLTFSTDGILWIGTTRGLFQYNNNTFYNIGIIHPSLSERITALASVGDSLWIGTRGNGLFMLVKNQLMQFTTSDGLPSNSISTIEKRTEDIIIGTNNGLALIKRKMVKNKPAMYNHFSASNLLSSEIKKIIFNSNKTYIASKEGISIMENSYAPHDFAMPVHITGVQVQNVVVENIKGLNIPYNKNSISIDYFAISYENPGKRTYRHKLLGLQEEWVINQKTTSQYPYLPPGQYTFNVEVLNSRGDWNAAGTSLSFTVLKPFWSEWWFILILLVGSILIIAVIFSLTYSVSNKRKKIMSDLIFYRQEALANQMNPHFLFNALNTVQRYILENDKMSSSRYLSKFANLMRTMLNNAQQQNLSLQNEIDALNIYLELESARFKDRFDYMVHYESGIDPQKIMLPVFLIQPLAENAIKHGLMNSPRHGILDIYFRKEKNDLICEITDNGIGRKAAQEISMQKGEKSLGISIIQKRLSLINQSHKANIYLTYIDLTDEEETPCGTKAVMFFQSMDLKPKL